MLVWDYGIKIGLEIPVNMDVCWHVLEQYSMCDGVHVSLAYADTTIFLVIALYC